MNGLNFLPWRQQKREKIKRQFFLLFSITVMFGLLIIVVGHTMMVTAIQKQKEQNAFLNQQLKEENINLSQHNALLELKKNKIAQLKSIKALNDNRNVVVYLCDELVRVIPTDLYISKLIREENTVYIDGYARSNDDVTTLLKNLENSSLFTSVKLNFIKPNESKESYPQQFQIMLSMNPSAKSLGGGKQ